MVVDENKRLLGIVTDGDVRRAILKGVSLDALVLNVIHMKESFDMTELFTRLIDQGFETVAFPIREYWMDIGRVEDYKKANGDYSNKFQK